jgi:hypothetical protein
MDTKRRKLLCLPVKCKFRQVTTWKVVLCSLPYQPSTESRLKFKYTNLFEIGGLGGSYWFEQLKSLTHPAILHRICRPSAHKTKHRMLSSQHTGITINVVPRFPHLVSKQNWIFLFQSPPRLPPTDPRTRTGTNNSSSNKLPRVKSIQMSCDRSAPNPARANLGGSAQGPGVVCGSAAAGGGGPPLRGGARVGGERRDSGGAGA